MKPLITKGTTAQIGNLNVVVNSIEHDHVELIVNGRLQDWSFKDVETLFGV